jgi:cellulose synthase/poly-beta-1,6-N-acetylglucosamine synthase-like glycosyltransferase
MEFVAGIILILSLAVFALSLFGLYLTLYTWEHPDRLAASRGPEEPMRPQLSFTAIVPARNEEAVINETIRRIWQARYPKRLLEILVVCHVSDTGTIAEARRAANNLDPKSVRVLTFSDPPLNKPHGLNVALAEARRQVVTIFDAEDDVHPELFRMVNHVMVTEQVNVVQAGVQLMNFRDQWFGIHNCLEYFFWFKSRLHFHANAGMIPLGGNTVFIRRDVLLRAGGWDVECLTEDADIGIRLSAMGERIRVVYDAEKVTREETPDSVGSWIRQRTRWNQGFVYLLRKGTWLRLPRWRHRFLALYTLSYPLLQALLFLLWPTVVIGILLIKAPLPVALASFLPLYALVFQFVVQMVGAVMFTGEYGQRLPLTTAVGMAFTFLPYQWMLGISALRAVYRELEIKLGWEKTHHRGAHRQAEVTVVPTAPVLSAASGATSYSASAVTSAATSASAIVAAIGSTLAPAADVTRAPYAGLADGADFWRFCRHCGRRRPPGLAICPSCANLPGALGS